MVSISRRTLHVDGIAYCPALHEEIEAMGAKQKPAAIGGYRKTQPISRFAAAGLKFEELATPIRTAGVVGAYPFHGIL